MEIELTPAANVTSQDCKRLKAKYLQRFAAQGSHVTTWRQVVADLVELGISRKTLLHWAIQAGYNAKYVAVILSKILCSIGHRERAPGGGRKSSPEVEDLLAIVIGRYGRKYLTVLAATLKTGKAREEAEKFSEEQRVSLALLVGTNKNPKDCTMKLLESNVVILTTDVGRTMFTTGIPRT